MLWGLVLAGVVLLTVTVLALRGEKSGDPSQLATAPARRGPLVISVSESGAIKPREQIILRNELDDPATILSIVEEGRQVKKGDLLCELDVTASRKQLVERRIRVQSAEAALIFAEESFKISESQAQADIEAAELAYSLAKGDLRQYLEGDFPKLKLEAEAKITIAEQELSQAKETLDWSFILFQEKYLSRTAYQKDELALRKAELAVELAKADKKLLEGHTHTKQMATLESAVKQTGGAVGRTAQKARATMAQAESDVKAKKALLEAEKAELDQLESEVAKAKIKAPIDGMVLYASSVAEYWDNDEDRIDVGAVVDERGEIIYLPTASAHNVDVKTLEVNLRKIRLGQPARIYVDAMPGRSFAGKVAAIGQLPDQESRWMNPNLKLYNVKVHVEGTDPALRNGMSCRVEIMVEQYADAVHVPIQSVTRIAGQSVVYLLEDGKAVPRPVEIDLDNGQFVHIRSGLNGGEQVLLAPPLKAGDERERKEEDQERQNGEGPPAPPGGNRGPGGSASGSSGGPSGGSSGGSSSGSSGAPSGGSGRK